MKLDMRRVINDPRFADKLLVTRRLQDIGPDGRAVNYPKTYKCLGVIVNDTPDELKRFTEGSRGSKSITIYSAFGFIADEQDVDADIVLWGGEDHMVKGVLDWRHLGGFYVAVAWRVPYQGEG